MLVHFEAYKIGTHNSQFNRYFHHFINFGCHANLLLLFYEQVVEAAILRKIFMSYVTGLHFHLNLNNGVNVVFERVCISFMKPTLDFIVAKKVLN